MKSLIEIFRKYFTPQKVQPFLVFGGAILAFEFLIFPALTDANTAANLGGGFLAVALLGFLFVYFFEITKHK